MELRVVVRGSCGFGMRWDAMGYSVAYERATCKGRAVVGCTSAKDGGFPPHLDSLTQARVRPSSDISLSSLPVFTK